MTGEGYVRIDTEYLTDDSDLRYRIGGLAPGEWEIVGIRRHRAEGLYLNSGNLGAVNLGEGFYVVLMQNATLDSVTGSGVTMTLVHFANTTSGLSWPSHTDNFYRVVVSAGGLWTGGTWTEVEDFPPPGSVGFPASAYSVWGIELTGTNPTPLLPCRFIERFYPPGGNHLHCQDTDGDWVPELPTDPLFDVFESFFA